MFGAMSLAFLREMRRSDIAFSKLHLAIAAVIGGGREGGGCP